MFDEYMKPPRVERPVSPAPAGTPSSTTIDQDAPSPSHSSSSSALQSPSLHQGVAVESTLMEDNPFAPVDNHPFINVFALEPSSEASSSGDLSLAESPYEMDIREKDEKSSKNRQNQARSGKAKVKSKQKSKSTPTKSTVKTDAENEEYLMGPPEPI
ncbi:hypothetical protein Tco_1542173 [Tanacetum coccineum]